MSDTGARFWLPSSAPVLRRVAQFNYHPLEYARTERLKKLVPAPLELERLRQSPSGAKRFVRWLFAQWGLTDPYVFDFEGGANRIALLSPQALEELAERLGLIASAKIIVRCIRRVDRERLIAALGEERRRYAVTHAALYNPPFEDSSSDTLTLDLVRRRGWWCILRSIDFHNPALWNRFCLKLPQEIDADEMLGESATHWNPQPEQGDAAAFVARVLKLEFPEEWEQCFS